VSQHPDWLKTNKVRFIAQIGSKRLHDLPDVPLITELAANDKQRGILKLISSLPGLGQPYLAPPGTPPERLAILRSAFMETMKDSTFLKEAAALNLDVDPINAQEITQMILDVINTAADIAAKTRFLLNETAGSGK